MPDIIIPCPTPNRADFDSDEAWVLACEHAGDAAMRSMSAKLRRLRRKVYMRRRRAEHADLCAWFAFVKDRVAECVAQQRAGNLTPENAGWLRRQGNRLKKAAVAEREMVRDRDRKRAARKQQPNPEEVSSEWKP